MRRKSTKQSRGPNAAEKRHMAWLKDRGICTACGDDGGVINHHAAGSACKVRVGLERVHIGHWFVIGLCRFCDAIVTRGSHRALTDIYGPECELWARQIEEYSGEVPDLVNQGIAQWAK